MDDGADVSLVDPHTEGDCSDDDVEFAGEKGTLHTVTRGGIKAGMVGGSGEVLVQFPGKLFCRFARCRIDDGGASRRLFEQLQRKIVALWLGEFYDLDGEVIPAKAGDEDGRLL